MAGTMFLQRMLVTRAPVVGAGPSSSAWSAALKQSTLATTGAGPQTSSQEIHPGIAHPRHIATSVAPEGSATQRNSSLSVEHPPQNFGADLPPAAVGEDSYERGAAREDDSRVGFHNGSAPPAPQATEEGTEPLESGSGSVAELAAEFPVQVVPSAVAGGSPRIFRSADAGRAPFVIGTSGATLDFSSGVLQRLSAPGRRTLQKIGEQPAPPGLTRTGSVGRIGAGPVSTTGNKSMYGGSARSFVTRLPGNTLGATLLRAGSPALHRGEFPVHVFRQTREASHLLEPQGFMSSIRPGLHAASNGSGLINRFPGTFAASELPLGAPPVVGSPLGAAPLRHVTPGGPAIARILQRQPQRTAPAGGQAGAPPPVPAAPAPAQNTGVNVTQLAEQVYGLLVRRIASERERRGL